MCGGVNGPPKKEAMRRDGEIFCFLLLKKEEKAEVDRTEDSGC